MTLQAFDRSDLDQAGYVIPGEQKNRTVTPFFRYESVFNEPQSQIQGKPVHDVLPVVEIRFAGDRNYKPVFGVDEIAFVSDDQQKITWAERYKAQYQAFLAGSEQEAEGTPLEELLPYGISPAQLSLCRALNIYSVEAVAFISEGGRKKLGQHGNDLIPMAKRYLDARRDGSQQQTEINELRRQIAELRVAQIAPSNVVPAELPPLPVENPLGAAAMSDSEVKDEIERLTGARPRGNPSRATLDMTLEQARAAS